MHASLYCIIFTNANAHIMARKYRGHCDYILGIVLIILFALSQFIFATALKDPLRIFICEIPHDPLM